VAGRGNTLNSSGGVTIVVPQSRCMLVSATNKIAKCHLPEKLFEFQSICPS
jgi:hypothetical protein